ncbi:MAG: hypothetical protein ACOCX4_08385, partial [Planctomycetota bacterium]
MKTGHLVALLVAILVLWWILASGPRPAPSPATVLPRGAVAYLESPSPAAARLGHGPAETRPLDPTAERLSTELRDRFAAFLGNAPLLDAERILGEADGAALALLPVRKGETAWLVALQTRRPAQFLKRVGRFAELAFAPAPLQEAADADAEPETAMRAPLGTDGALWAVPVPGALVLTPSATAARWVLGVQQGDYRSLAEDPAFRRRRDAVADGSAAWGLIDAEAARRNGLVSASLGIPTWPEVRALALGLTVQPSGQRIRFRMERQLPAGDTPDADAAAPGSPPLPPLRLPGAAEAGGIVPAAFLAELLPPSLAGLARASRTPLGFAWREGEGDAADWAVFLPAAEKAPDAGAPPAPAGLPAGATVERGIAGVPARVALAEDGATERWVAARLDRWTVVTHSSSMLAAIITTWTASDPATRPDGRRMPYGCLAPASRLKTWLDLPTAWRERTPAEGRWRVRFALRDGAWRGDLMPLPETVPADAAPAPAAG